MADLAVIPAALDEFYRRWEASGAAERANYSMFLNELCDLLEVPRPDPAGPDDEKNADRLRSTAATRSALEFDREVCGSLATQSVRRPWRQTLPAEQAQAVRAVLAEHLTGIDHRITGSGVRSGQHPPVSELLQALFSLGRASAL
jgi:hypothetical protein